MQCLSIVVAHSQVNVENVMVKNSRLIFLLFFQARDNPTAKTNSLPARGLGNSRTAF